MSAATLPRRRLAAAAGVVILAMALLTGCLSADQQRDLDLVNQARSANRKSALTSHAAAAKKAQSWSQHMASTGKLEHTGGGTHLDTSGLSGWCSLGENVGYGPSVQAVHDAFMRSSQHKANILGSFNTVGTGVVKKGSTYWVTEIYLRTNC